MVNYVTDVLISNLGSGAVLSAAPASAASLNTASNDAGKWIIMNCDPNVASNKIYEVTAANASEIETIKVGIVTKKNAVLRAADGTVTYTPIIQWSNEIKAKDIKSFNTLSYAADTEDQVCIDLTSLDSTLLSGTLAKAGKRIIVRLTFKDMPHRYRKWTESYEYVTADGDTKATIAAGIAKMINKEWKRARVSAVVGDVNSTSASADATVGNKYFHKDSNWGTSSATTGTAVLLEALPYDDDDSVDTLNVANKVRFNANVYFTDPAAEGWASLNKNFPTGVTITKTPGKQYPASAKLVRDRESWAMGYRGILNRGEGTWPIIKPAMETDLTKHYDAITLEYENMYRAADDIQRKTKQVVEIYGITSQLSGLSAILSAFVSGVISSSDAAQNAALDPTVEGSLAARVAALETTVAAL